MDYHYHARLTIVGREELAKRVLEGRLSLKADEAEFKLSRQGAAKWGAAIQGAGSGWPEGSELASLAGRHAGYRRSEGWRSSG